MICALDCEAGDLEFNPGSGGITSSIGLDWIIGEVMTCTVGSAGNKLFHPYQVGTFVDYQR